MKWEKKYNDARFSLNMAALSLGVVFLGVSAAMGYAFYLEPLKMSVFLLGLAGFFGFSYILGRITF